MSSARCVRRTVAPAGTEQLSTSTSMPSPGIGTATSPDPAGAAAQVVGVRLHGSVLTEGAVDLGKLRPVARLGYTQEYSVISELL